MINPECTKGTVMPDPHNMPMSPQLHVAICGCGWREGGFTSRTKAKAAQRAHRFPPFPQPAFDDLLEPGVYRTEGGASITEGVCLKCGRLLYQARDGAVVTDVWHPFGILAGNPVARIDGVTVQSPAGDCSAQSTGRPGVDAFVIGIPLNSRPSSCYICGDPDDHSPNLGEAEPCPTGLLRDDADDLRAAVGLFPYPHPMRRDPND